MLEKDNIDAALPSVKALNDERIHHFYDGRKTVGKIIANSVGWQGKVAWDIYLFYLPNVEWTATPPSPKFWMHQLKDAWATKNTFRTGPDLQRELSTSMEKLQNN